jgi:hypothetical protein
VVIIWSFQYLGNVSWDPQSIPSNVMSQPYPRARDQSKGLQGCGPRGTHGSHFTCSRECKGCEGMNLHTHKWTPMLGVGVLKGLPNFQSAILGVKTPCLEDIVMTFLVRECYGSPKISIKFVKIRQNLLKFVKIHARRMLWQGVKWRILKNFILQNEECHH